MEETLTTTQDVLFKLLLPLPAPEQVIVSQKAQLVFLKNLNVLKSLYQNQNQDDYVEEHKEVCTVIIG